MRVKYFFFSNDASYETKTESYFHSKPTELTHIPANVFFFNFHSGMGFVIKSSMRVGWWLCLGVNEDTAESNIFITFIMHTLGNCSECKKVCSFL